MDPESTYKIGRGAAGYAARTIHPSRKSNATLTAHFQALTADLASTLK